MQILSSLSIPAVDVLDTFTILSLKVELPPSKKIFSLQ